MGDKVTRIWQLLPASTLSPQLLVWVNSPTVTILEMASGMLPLLVSVTFCVAEVPKTTVVKFTEVGDNRTTVPVATRLTTWGLVESLSVMVSVPLLLPEKVGVKVTLMLHCAIAATDDPQALLAEKPALAATLEMVRVVRRLLKSTNVLAALLDPTTVGLNMLGPEIKGQVRCCRMRGGRQRRLGEIEAVQGIVGLRVPVGKRRQVPALFDEPQHGGKLVSGVRDVARLRLGRNNQERNART